jgi:hypothetical protein
VYQADLRCLHRYWQCRGIDFSAMSCSGLNCAVLPYNSNGCCCWCCLLQEKLRAAVAAAEASLAAHSSSCAADAAQLRQEVAAAAEQAQQTHANRLSALENAAAAQATAVGELAGGSLLLHGLDHCDIQQASHDRGGRRRRLCNGWCTGHC